jgi:hypothetical protein
MNAEARSIMTAKLKTMATEVLVEISRKLARDYTSHAGIVSDAVLSELESRMASSEFVALCDELYEAMA